MASRVIYIVLAFPVVLCSQNDYRNEGFMNHINTGIKLAQNFMGSESVALKVADFVVRAFHNGNTATSPGRPGSATSEELAEQRPELVADPQPPAAPWRHLVRLLGLDPSQISAVAVNALIFVTQMITSFLARPRRPNRPSRPYRAEESIDWILKKNSKKLQDLIATAKNESLTDLVEDLVEDNGGQEDTSCIRLLVCKITPFVIRMQRVVFGEERADAGARGAAGLHRQLPAAQDVAYRSEACEQKYRACDLNE